MGKLTQLGHLIADILWYCFAGIGIMYSLYLFLVVNFNVSQSLRTQVVCACVSFALTELLVAIRGDDE